MSTGTVLGDVVARAELAGLSVGWVETTFDVDEVEDIEHLRELVRLRTDLAATRAALAALGLCGDGGRDAAGLNGTQDAAGMLPESYEGEGA